jgi:hypothetical protein
MLDHCGNNHNSMLGTLLPDIRNIILLYVPFDGIFVCVLDALTWLADLLHLDLKFLTNKNLSSIRLIMLRTFKL